MYMAKRTKIGLLILLLPPTLYLLTYVANSALGGYWLMPMFSWQHHTFTAYYWQPRFGYYTPHRNDAIGRFYSPLINVDRALFHPTVDKAEMSFEDFTEWMGSLRLSQVHPEFRGFQRVLRQLVVLSGQPAMAGIVSNMLREIDQELDDVQSLTNRMHRSTD